MHAMIQNDEEKEWMLPLLELRNELDVGDDRHLRDFRRMSGRVQLFNERLIHGPYTQESRANWLSKLLRAQTWIRKSGPSEVRELELITDAELHEIRRVWVEDKHEFEDLLPGIYEAEVGAPYDGPEISRDLPLGSSELALLAEQCGDDRLHYELVRDLLDVERRHRLMVRRAGLFDELEKTLRRSFFTDAEDAHAFALTSAEMRSAEPTPIDDFLQVTVHNAPEEST